MITSLSGTLSTVGLDWVEVTVGGVGLRVNVPSSLIDQVGQVGDGVKLFTSLQVKEDSLTLYGFPSSDGRQAFEALLGVNGVGPRVALSILSTLAPDELANAVAVDDLDAFKGVTGVGRRTAQRIAMELKGKLDVELTVASVSGPGSEWSKTLTEMGYGESEIQAYKALVTNSEVSPKVALSILSSLSLEDLAIAVEINDLDAFNKVPGVGPKTAMSITTALKGKLDIELPPILISKREAELLDALTTMGYGDSEILAYNSLISHSDVSPKVALSILSSLTLEELAIAVEVDDLDTLNGVPGVGSKTAQQIVTNLKGKLDIELTSPIPIKPDEELLDALTPLGYSSSEVALAAASLPQDEPMELEDKVRLSLEYLVNQ